MRGCDRRDVTVRRRKTLARLASGNCKIGIVAGGTGIEGEDSAVVHVEERIYDGFPGPDDENRMASFHTANRQDALAIVQQFNDDRLRIFGLRLIYMRDRSVLPSEIGRAHV